MNDENQTVGGFNDPILPVILTALAGVAYLIVKAVISAL